MNCSDIKSNLLTVKRSINEAELTYGRAVGSVKLVAVSKTRSIDEVSCALKAGQQHFGESYLQDALPKITALADHRLVWHFIGPAQSNKIKAIAENFDWVHSINSIKTALRFNKYRPENLPALNICLQINISQEPGKSGASAEEAPAILKAITELPRLRLRGLMAIPVRTDNFERQRRQFSLIRQLMDNLNNQGYALDTLSIGMSDDMEAAIAENSTIVRIGTAIFGERHDKHTKPDIAV